MIKNAKQKRRLGLLAAAGFWLGVWQLTAMAVGQPVLLPTPGQALAELVRLLPAPELWQRAAFSAGRILLGFGLGAVCSTLLAAAAWRWTAVELLLAPVMQLVKATPVASFIILALVWVSGRSLSVLISFLMVLPVLWGNVCKGISQTDGQLLEAARAYRFGRWKTLRLVYVPSVLPYFASGCATGLGLAWKAGVAAEVLCQPRLAIGTQVYRAKITLETPDLFAWTAVVIALSFLLEYALGLLFRRLGKGAKL